MILEGFVDIDRKHQHVTKKKYNNIRQGTMNLKEFYKQITLRQQLQRFKINYVTTISNSTQLIELKKTVATIKSTKSAKNIDFRRIYLQIFIEIINMSLTKNYNNSRQSMINLKGIYISQYTNSFRTSKNLMTFFGGDTNIRLEQQPTFVWNDVQIIDVTFKTPRVQFDLIQVSNVYQNIQTNS